MRGANVEVNPQLETLFRKNESGDEVSFLTFGKEIFKQVELNETKLRGGVGYWPRNERPNSVIQKSRNPN